MSNDRVKNILHDNEGFTRNSLKSNQSKDNFA